jgi:N-acetylglutamate synthase
MSSMFDGNDNMIKISQFKIESYADVLSLWQQCAGIGLSYADSRENIQQYLERNSGTSFIATCNGNLVGAVLAGHDGRHGYIHHLAVRTDYRRQGIGRKLVDHCLSVLSDLGIQKCHLFIFNNNTGGIEFWKSIGWTPRSDIGVISKTIEPITGSD